MKGRKPKSVEVRVREGNPGHRPLPDRVAVGGRTVPAALAEPPDYIGEDGKTWWREEVPLAAGSGLLDLIDRSQLAMMATQWDDWVKARRVIALDGHFVRGSVGQLREHPAMKIAREAETAFNRNAENFGFNPMGRTRLGLQVLKAHAVANELHAALDGDGDTWEGTASDGDVGLPGV